VTFQVSTLSQKDFVMIQITDTHLLEYPHLEFVGMQPEQSFHAVIDLMRQTHPEIDLIVHTGDLAQNPTPLTYHRYLEYMHSLSIPFFKHLGITMMSIIFHSMSKTRLLQQLSSLEIGVSFY
jgi:Icc protein